jgi:DNA-binding transcriptional LysR family regulator
MDWDKLKVFHAAAEAGSFTHAGEQSDCRNRRFRAR